MELSNLLKTSNSSVVCESLLTGSCDLWLFWGCASAEIMARDWLTWRSLQPLAGDTHQRVWLCDCIGPQLLQGDGKGSVKHAQLVSVVCGWMYIGLCVRTVRLSDCGTLSSMQFISSPSAAAKSTCLNRSHLSLVVGSSNGHIFTLSCERRSSTPAESVYIEYGTLHCLRFPVNSSPSQLGPEENPTPARNS